jgi:phage tail tape-measure protein
MDNNSDLPVVAIFPNFGLAEAAVDELWHAGFKKNEIGIASRGERLHEAATPIGHLEDEAATGAAAGAITGSVVGALAGAAAGVAIPGLGPVVASGLLMGLGGAAAGAALGSFVGPFVAMGLSEEAARRYEHEFRSGRTIVVVKTQGWQEKAASILESHGPIRVEVGGSAFCSAASA